MASETNLKPIIDSALLPEEALQQNPLSPAPEDILKEQVVLQVTYVGFDARIHQGQIVIHKNVARDVEDFFKQALKLQFPIYSVIPISDERFHFDDEVSCNQNNTSGYNYRTIMGSAKLSNHARGLAFDVNPVQNIYARFDETGKETYRLPPTGQYDTNAPGTLFKEHPLVQFMEERGWFWGGDWGPANGLVDYQHFEKQ